MSFQNKDFWMLKAPIDSEITRNNSTRIEPKRSHQWFMDGADAELFPNKKQAIEIPHPNSYTALLNSNIYCGNSSNFHSVSSQFTERLFDNETPTTTTDLFAIDPTFGLSISHPLVDPQTDITYSGIKKVKIKVSQVKDDESVTMGLSFDRGNDVMISMSENNIAMDAFNDHNNALSMRHAFGNGDNNIISFGGLNDDVDNVTSSGSLVCNYDFFMGQPSLQRSEEKGLTESTSDAFVSGVQITPISKRKEQKSTKKSPPNNFPSNVRSLLSTGMLDGVPVKYVAWSREELRGVIKGAAYLCGCQSCTFSKAVNAYEFERHAGCKTKHPNNHIYFDNGKTIYGVVQELRNTPQNVLFEVIQTITGSPINQKSFRLWKDSFLAATRELQRIYGKEEGKNCVIES